MRFSRRLGYADFSEAELKKLKPIKGSTACLTCGCGSHDTLPMTAILAVGFGDVTVFSGDKIIYSEMDRDRRKLSLWTASKAEQAAKKAPTKDWRIKFDAPLYEAEYQRQGVRHWVLIRKGQGFA